MTNKKDKKPMDENSKPHGLWELYYNKILVYSCHHLHGKEDGLLKDFNNLGELLTKVYIIN